MKIGTDPQRLIKYIRQRLDYPVEPGRKEKIQSSTDNWIIRAYYIYALESIGSDNYDFKGKILYEGDDGRENTIYEDRDIRIWNLFSKIYKDY